jgi:hypothetical protein
MVRIKIAEAEITEHSLTDHIEGGRDVQPSAHVRSDARQQILDAVDRARRRIQKNYPASIISPDSISVAMLEAGPNSRGIVTVVFEFEG